MNDQNRYSADYDPDNFIAATDLSVAIQGLIDTCKRHMDYIQAALDTAEDYAGKLRDVTVPLSLYYEGWNYVGFADNEMRGFDLANEAALNLRRAGDVSLNDHYG